MSILSIKDEDGSKGAETRHSIHDAFVNKLCNVTTLVRHEWLTAKLFWDGNSANIYHCTDIFMISRSNRQQFLFRTGSHSRSNGPPK